MELEVIEQLFKSRSSQTTEDGAVTEQEKDFRAEQLKDVLGYIKQNKASGSDELDFIAEKLGNGARDASWRLPLAESGILEFFLSILPEDGLRQRLRIQTLRVIGNSCADTGMEMSSEPGSPY
jgi:hypothetical protein